MFSLDGSFGFSSFFVGAASCRDRRGWKPLSQFGGLSLGHLLALADFVNFLVLGKR